MAVEQLTPPRAPRPQSESKLVKYDEYIDTQIKNTRRAVKLVDLATALVLLATGVLAFLLVAAIVEHWLVPGGLPVAVRSALFALLVGGVGYFAYRRLWPLVRRAINPVYAAQTIERSSPTLKNSLINLLLFRQHRAEISDAVYKTLEEQAAQRLTRVPVDAAVDRSLLIRVGYGLLAVVALAALYKLFSPKDPFVAAERVLMPWRDIVPASRVTISNVMPGTLTVSRGESLTVSADVRGIHENDPVLLRYTTDDGQAVDKPLEMKLSRDGLRFEGRLPDDATGNNKLGLTQSFKYRIEAGDARSLDYEVTVVPAPSILVERVEYDFPEYTGYVDRSVEDLGDIRAIEGTRVTVHARANGPIKEAQVDFDADGRRDLTMTANGVSARASFALELREDRQTPRHASYVLRFNNEDGRPNRDPVKHPIVVEPDLVPETSILVPQEKSLDVRLNDTVAIGVDAIDPDFALAEVRLRGEVAGRSVLDEPLLAREHTGRFTGRYQFKPSAKGLKAGDVVQYWVTANDNRTPAANVAESERKLLRIVSPDAKQPPPDRIAQRDQRPQQGNQQQEGEQQQEGNQQGEPNQGGQPNQGNQSGEAAQDGQTQDGQQQNGGNGESASADGNQGEQRNGNSASADGKNEGQREGESASADGQQGSGSENNPAGSEQQGSQQGKQNKSNKQQGEQTGAGTADGESSQQGSPSAGTRPDPNNSGRPTNNGKQNGTESAEPAPVSSEGDNDAEAFKRIQKHLERSGDLKRDESTPQESNESGREAEPSANREQQKQEDEDTGQQGERNNEQNGEKNTSKGESNSADQKNQSQQRDGESASADGKQQGKQRDAAPQNQTGQQTDEQGEGTGAETRQDDLPEGGQQQPRDAANQEKSSGGQQTAAKGESGAGNQEQSEGAPNSQPEMKPTEKREQTSSDGKQTDEKEPAAGARGKRESDSQGEEGGDKAGGGEEGGGQKTPREGTGSAGQNQSADEGAGESSEKGTGNASPNAGTDAKASDRTGQTSGETHGRGTKQRPGEGEKPSGEAGNADNQSQGNSDGEQSNRDAQPSAPNEKGQGNEQQGKQEKTGSEANQNQPGDESAQSAESQGEQNIKTGDEQAGSPTGDGGNTGTDGPSRSSQGEAPAGDEANLEYARKKTDLVLDKLADQLNKKNVDDQLLKDLGWTQEDLRRFVERWNQRKEAARRADQNGESQRELDEALRSLGLRPGTLQQSIQKDDRQRDLREGFRGPVPAKYRDQLQKYNRGISRAGRDDAE